MWVKFISIYLRFKKLGLYLMVLESSSWSRMERRYLLTLINKFSLDFIRYNLINKYNVFCVIHPFLIGTQSFIIMLFDKKYELLQYLSIRKVISTLTLHCWLLNNFLNNSWLELSIFLQVKESESSLLRIFLSIRYKVGRVHYFLCHVCPSTRATLPTSSLFNVHSVKCRR